jgi:catechol 2,3-dioxygenase-like lactoylglutathione lyase family enzyme
LLRVG